MNEEGLPIIDITEPVDDKPSQSTEPLPSTNIVEEPFTPLSSLPPSARARRNDQVKRILDYLEEEERQEELKEKQRQSQERSDSLQKQKLQEEKDKASIKARKELQKKMGRALLQNIGKAKEKERQEQEAQRLLDEAADKNRSPSLKKKTVAFVDALDSSENDTVDTPESSEAPDWGDVTLARLRASKRPTLLSQSLLDKHPMKMSVVERFPSTPALPHSPHPRHPRQKFADSDDESDPAPETDSSDTAAEDEDDSQSIIIEQDEVDLDFAQHQRQIAIEYHERRSKFGQDAAEAIMNPSYTDDTPLVKKQHIFSFQLLTGSSFIFRNQRLASLGNLQSQQSLISERIVSHPPTTHQCQLHPLLSEHQLSPPPVLAPSNMLSEWAHLTQMVDLWVEKLIVRAKMRTLHFKKFSNS